MAQWTSETTPETLPGVASSPWRPRRRSRSACERRARDSVFNARQDEPAARASQNDENRHPRSPKAGRPPVGLAIRRLARRFGATRLWLDLRRTFRPAPVHGARPSFSFGFGDNSRVGFDLGSGLKRRQRLTGDLQDRGPILLGQFIGRVETRADFRPVSFPRPPVTARSASAIRSIGVESNRPVVSAIRTAICPARKPGEFRLVQTGANASPMFDSLARVIVQAGAETGEGFKAPRTARKRALGRPPPRIGRPLRLAANARNGFADIDRRQHAPIRTATAKDRFGHP